MNFEIKNRWSGKVLFSIDVDLKLSVGAQIGFAVKAAIDSDANLGGADLRGANLGGADLRDANLGDADLRDADLRDANLRGANLGGADLRDANLGGADLRDANLRGANLGGASLWSTIGNKKHLHSMQIERFDICFGFGFMQIGCQRHTIEEWREKTVDDVDHMDVYAREWWGKWKDIIFSVIDKVGG